MVGAAVVHPRGRHQNRPGRGRDLTLAGVAVADHQPPPALIPLGGMRGQIVVDLGLQGSRQPAPGALMGQLIQAHA